MSPTRKVAVDQQEDTHNYRPVTMRDIATHCRVSIWTVSLALRHDPRVSQVTTEHVLAVATELGYDPAVHQAARRLVSKRLGKEVMNNVVGLLLPPHFQTANYFAYTSLGILDVLASEGYGVLTSYLTPFLTDEVPHYPSIYARGEVDGAIGAGYLFESAALHALRANPGFGNRPVISLLLPRPGCSSVTTDDQHGAYTATMHLLELGHRHLLHFFSAEGIMQAPRLRGMCQAMQQYGLDPDRHLHALSDLSFGDIHPPYHLLLPDLSADTEAAAAVRRNLDLLLEYLKAHREVTAILAPNDPTARRLWFMLQYRGVHIPEEISLIGFDDTDGVVDEFGQNLLTSVRLPLERLGQEAAGMIIRQLTSETREVEHRVLPTELVVRHSTTFPRVLVN